MINASPPLLTHALQNPVRKRLCTCIVLFGRRRSATLVFWETSVYSKVTSALRWVCLNIAVPYLFLRHSILAHAEHMLWVWVCGRTLNVSHVARTDCGLLWSWVWSNSFTGLSEGMVWPVLLCWHQLYFCRFYTSRISSARRRKALFAFRTAVHLSLEHLNKWTPLWSYCINSTLMQRGSLLIVA